MAKLVIGSNKQNGIPAIVKEVGVQPSLGTKNITANGTYNASSDNYDGYSSVTVNVPGPSGTKYISDNGVYDVATFANVNVHVNTVAEPYLELEVMPNGNLRHSTTTSRLLPLSGFTGINSYVLAGAYYGNTTISGPVVFQDLTNISGTYACAETFYGTRVSGFSAPSLTNVGGERACYRMFVSSQITYASMPSLVTVSATWAFYEAFSKSRVSSIDVSSLQTVSGLYAFSRAFYDCDYLTTISFPVLENITGQKAFYWAFASSTISSLSFPALKSTSFGSYKDQFDGMLTGVTDCMIHFPTNLNPALGSTVISSLNGYPDFGGTHTQLSFDLPATE